MRGVPLKHVMTSRDVRLVACLVTRGVFHACADNREFKRDV